MQERNANVGYVDGSVPATTQRFDVVLDEGAVLELDDLVVCRHDVADGGGQLTHYGIVVEGVTSIEGAKLPSDTQRIFGTQTMPGQRARKATVQILRTHPERWLPPHAGARVELARGDDHDLALFQDRMEENRLAVGLDHTHQPVFVDWTFLNGEKGAHISVSGISGVAAKTSYALFALHMLLETDDGRALLGQHVAGTRAVVFNVKGEDLLHIDRPNRKFDDNPDAHAMWRALGVEQPRPFQNVRLYVPARRGDVVLAPRVTSRPADDVTIFGWTPLEFIRRGLLSFVFSDARDRNQISFVIDHVRAEMARRAVPSSHTPGAVIMRSQRIQGRPADFDRSADELSRAGAENANGDQEIRDFNELVHYISAQLVGDDQTQPNPQWAPQNIADATNEAFIRRLHAMNRRIGQLVHYQAVVPELDRTVSVIDINSLHDDAQRFVVGAVLDGIWQEKQASGREPLRFIVLDELNKYAPKEGHSPIKEILVDIAARGRSLGVILIGCQQNATRVDSAIVDNAAIKVVGRLDASHADEYKFLSAELRQRATRFLPGTMVLDQPIVPAPIPVIFPFPPYATNVSESGPAAGDIDGPDPLEMLRP